MSNERKLAVLIDSDNVSAKYAPFIMEEVSKYGTPTFKRVYGDWEKGGNGWHYPAINYSIMPMQQSSYIAGKNATDFSMIIDAMDILYSGKVDGFVLVTSDSDFTRLAIRLREAGMLVVGIGEVKTPRAFTISCHHFSYLNQVCEPEGMADEKTIRKAVLDYVTESNDEGMNLAKIFAVLTSRFGNINFDELGYKRFSNFIDSFPELTRRNTFVSLKKQRKEENPAPKFNGIPTEQEIINAISDYFKDNTPESDNMMKLESYLNSKFGKIDFSRFGSKRFARFIDKTDVFKRDGTNIFPVSEHPQPVKSTPAAVTENHEKASMETVSQVVLNYAGENMPDGGNIGQLNNVLISKFGKSYCSDIGFMEFKELLEAISDIKVRKNHVYLTDTKYAEFVESMREPVKITEKQPQPVPTIRTNNFDNSMQDPRHYAGGKPFVSENKPALEKSAADFRQTSSFTERVVVDKQDISGVKKTSVERPSPAINNSDIEKTDTAEVKQTDTAKSSDVNQSDIEKTDSTGAKQQIAEKSPDANYSDAEKASTAEVKQTDAVKSSAVNSSDTEQGAKAATQQDNAETSDNKQNISVNSENKDNETKTSENHPISGEKSFDDVITDEKRQRGRPSSTEKAKPEINTIKREILQFAATVENGTSAALGNTLSKKYGKNYLKELGYSSMKKLLEDIKGIIIDGNGLKISEEFAKRTEEIEKFVNDFARGEGTHSIRALGIQLKAKFQGFNFTDYGFGRFTDFINAIDGVHADRYHINSTDNDDML